MKLAVEFLQEKIKLYLPSIHQKGLEDAFKQAKEMEKQQIIDAVNVTSQNCVSLSNKVISAFTKIDGEFMHDENEAEKYYNETYGSKGSDVAKRLIKEMPKHIAIEVDAYAEKLVTSSQTEKMYSEEDLREALFFALNIDRTTCCTTRTTDSIVRESIQSLKQPKKD